MAQIQEFDIGCEPSPSVPAETVLGDGHKTYLVFWAVAKTIGESGYLDDLGVAVLDCQQCVACRFGYPNDEGLPEHPLYNCGIADSGSSVLEVLDSNWTIEVRQQKKASASRIWGARGMDSNRWQEWTPRHFIVLLKEKTFECLASAITVDRFCSTFDDAFAYVIGKLNEH